MGVLVSRMSLRDQLISAAFAASAAEKANNDASARMRKAGYGNLAKFMADTAEIYRERKVAALIEINRLDRAAAPQGERAAWPHVACTT